MLNGFIVPKSVGLYKSFPLKNNNSQDRYGYTQNFSPFKGTFLHPEHSEQLDHISYHQLGDHDHHDRLCGSQQIHALDDCDGDKRTDGASQQHILRRNLSYF